MMLLRVCKYSGKEFHQYNVLRCCVTHAPIATPKSKDFYELEAKYRRYYYLVDSRGQLFLEESKFRNYATCLKDRKFLDFFFRQLQPNKTKLNSNIPFVSLCGSEVNFVVVDDAHAPMVFSDLVESKSNSSICDLMIGGSSLRQTFDPSTVVFNTTSGRMYHPITTHKYLSGLLGLLHPSVADTLSTHLNISSSDKYTLCWKDGQEYNIHVVNDEE